MVERPKQKNWDEAQRRKGRKKNSTILDEIKERTALVDTTLYFLRTGSFQILTEIGTLSEKQIILERK